jgi:GGDEF domain-containing protein
MKRPAYSVSLLANGVLLLFLSFAMGLGEIFAWAGTALIAGGLFTLMSQIVTPPKTQFSSAGTDLLPESVSYGEVKKLLDAMAFPSAFLKKNEDGVDIVVAINDTLAGIVGLGKNEQQARGVPFFNILPNNEIGKTFKFADAEWVPHRTTKGRQTLFMLTPMLKVAESSGPTDAIDAETGLFTPLFLRYRANADVEACRRYGRKLSVVLFRISFEKCAIKPSDDAIKKAFAEFGRMVVASLRACDSGYRLREDEVLVYLPDTPQSGSKTVVNRVMDKVRKLSRVECVELEMAEIDEVTINYFGDEVVSVDEVMNDMYIAMGRKKD